VTVRMWVCMGFNHRDHREAQEDQKLNGQEGKNLNRISASHLLILWVFLSGLCVLRGEMSQDVRWIRSIDFALPVLESISMMTASRCVGPLGISNRWGV